MGFISESIEEITPTNKPEVRKIIRDYLKEHLTIAIGIEMDSNSIRVRLFLTDQEENSKTLISESVAEMPHREWED